MLNLLNLAKLSEATNPSVLFLESIQRGPLWGNGVGIQSDQILHGFYAFSDV